MRTRNPLHRSAAHPTRRSAAASSKSQQRRERFRRRYRSFSLSRWWEERIVGGVCEAFRAGVDASRTAIGATGMELVGLSRRRLQHESLESRILLASDLVISEIMYDPASGEDDWEWVEVFNPTDSAIDLSGYVLDDGNTVYHSSANIAAGSVPAGGVAVLYNADDLTSAGFESAWGTGINLIGVTNWSALGLNNSGDRVGLWTDFASYNDADFGSAGLVDDVEFVDGAPWPAADGAGSISLTEVSLDNDTPANWGLSADGFGGAFTSLAAGGNSGADVGSPGVVTSTATVYVDDDWAGTAAGADPDGAGPATAFGVDAFATIQEGLDAVDTDGTVTVGDGVYVENVEISKDLTLLSQNGRAATTIQGTSGAGGLGAVTVTGGTTGVQIGDTGQGFTIIGTDGNGAIENAAIYFQGNHSGATIRDNEIRAAGDSGLTTEYGATISDFVIDGNEFSGQTFAGTNPDGIGFSTQFNVGNNVPRQLVVMGGGTGGGSTSNITFTNNLLSGVAGGISSDDGVSEQGNTLVTIDVVGATITGNTFVGTTTRFGSALRARGSGTTISGNTFDASGMGALTNYLFLANPSETNGLSTDPDGLGDVAAANSFDPGVVTVPGNATVFIASGGIQGAIDASAPGAVLQFSGEFTENVDVNQALTVGGEFTLNGALTVSDSGATLDAGFSPGVIASGDLTLTAGSTLTAEVNGLAAGADHDQYVVTGAVDLGGATLDAFGTIAASPGDTVVLIDNDGADAVTGAFAGIANGGTVTINATPFTLFYDGGDGNDVVLVATPTTDTVYVDDDWAGTVSGADPDGGGPAVAFGVNAFDNITDAMAAVDVGGTVVVFDGAYSEALTIDKDLTLSADSVGGADVDAGGAFIGVTVDAAVTDLTISGFDFTGFTGTGVDAEGALTLEDSTITGGFTGLSVDGTTVEVAGTVISGALIFGVEVTSGGALLADASEFTGNGTAGVIISDGSADITRAAISGNGRGVLVAAAGAATITGSDLSGNTGDGLENASSGTIDASGNWWGSNAEADVLNATTGLVDFTPFLDSGADQDGGAVGFQGDFSALQVTTLGEQTAGNRVQEGVDGVDATGTVVVNDGTYDEIVTIGQSLTLQGATPLGATLAPTSGSQQTVITVDATDVTIDGLSIQVNQNDDGGGAPIAPVGIAAIGPAPGGVADFDGLTISNNQITSIGDNAVDWTGSPTLTVHSAGVVLYDNAGGGVPGVTLTDNDIQINSGTSFFQRAVWLAQVSVQMTGNTLAGAANDLLFQFASDGASLIDNNQFLGEHRAGGGGLNISGPNASATSIDVTNNLFQPSAGDPFNLQQSAVINQNPSAVPINFSGNTFDGHVVGITSGNAANVTISGSNTFTPTTVVGDINVQTALGGSDFIHVLVDSDGASSGDSTSLPISAEIYGNTFNPSATAGGVGSAIVVADNLVGSTFAASGVEIGVGGANTYSAGLTSAVTVAGGVATIADTITDAGVGVSLLAGTATLSGATLTDNTVGVSVGGLGTLTIGVGNTITGGVTGLLLDGAGAGVTGLSLGDLSIGGQSGDVITLANGALDDQQLDATGTTLDGVEVATATTAELLALQDQITDELDDNTLGRVLLAANTIFVTPVVTATPTDNDYTRIKNAVEAAAAGDTIVLGENSLGDGVFDWSEAYALASWEAGNDGVVDGGADDWTVLLGAGQNDVTVTADAADEITIQGPGDVAGANLEGVFVAFGNGTNTGWTFENFRILDFDNAIGFYYSSSDDFSGLTVQNMHIRVAADDAADANQNIGVHYGRGTNITIQDNLFELEGGGDGTSFAIQSNTHGGANYDGLSITGNDIVVLNAGDETIFGVWENGHAHQSDITVSGNSFTAVAGNAGEQTAFRLTSHSGATTTVRYDNNVVDGADTAFAWLDEYFGSPQDYTGTSPIELSGNTVMNTGVAFDVGGINASATITGGSVTGASGVGVEIADGSSATVSGVTLQNLDVGVAVGGAAVISGNFFDNADDNLVDVRIAATATAVTMIDSGNTFGGETYFVENLSTLDLDLTASGSTFDETDNFRIEDKLYHAPDDNAVGLVRVSAGELFVTSPGSGASHETIQNAIDAAEPGDSVFVEAGTFVEQVSITKDLALIGQGATTVIQSPTTLGDSFTYSGSTKQAVLEIDSATVSVSDLTVDGDGQGGVVTPGNDFVGIGVYNADATIDNVAVTAIRDAALNGNQRGRAIFIGNDTGTHLVSVSNSVIDDYQKNGIDARGAGLTVDLDSNTITGVGPTPLIAQNGIVLLGGVAGTVTNNVISDHEYTGTEVADSTGVLLYLNGAASVDATGNTLTDNEVGFFAFDSDATITGNQVSGSAVAGVEALGASTLTIGVGNTITGGVTGLLLDGAGAGVTGLSLGDLSIGGQSGDVITLANGALDDQQLDATGTTLDGVEVATATTAELLALQDQITDELDDNTLGRVLLAANTIFVTPVVTATPTDNDYTRIKNAVEAAAAGDTIVLGENSLGDGVFDWSETYALASWEAGNDGVVDGGADDWTVLLGAGQNDVTVTADAADEITIQGPGDVAGANLEGVFVAFGNGTNTGWTFENFRILDFDNAIGFYYSSSDDFSGLTVQNMHIRVAADDAADANQNIGVHYGRGTNITIQDNLFELEGGGDGTSFAIQSNTHGGANYDGLSITGNDIVVLNAGDETIFGVWENGHAHQSDVTVSGNSFTAVAGNAGEQTAFRLTSHSGATTTVRYDNNVVDGADTAFAWLDEYFGSPQDYTGTSPIELSGNTVMNTGVAFDVGGINASATITGGSVTGASGVGVEIADGSSATVSGVTLQNLDVGVAVGGAAVISGNFFDNADDNLVDVRIAATANAVTIDSGNTFGGETYFVENLSTLDLDLTASGSTFDETDNFRIEDKLYHAPDDNAVGLVRVSAGELFVTSPGSGASHETIQNAIDAAEPGDSVFVEAGTFVENLDISKAIDLIGAVDLGGVATTNLQAAAGGNLIELLGASFGADDEVTVSNFNLDGVAGLASAGVFVADTTDLASLQVTNGTVTGFNNYGVGVFGDAVTGDSVDSVALDGLSFSSNGLSGSSGTGDIQFFLYNNDAALSNLTLVGSADASTGARLGIQFRGVGDADGTGVMPMGTVSLDNVDVSGDYRTQMIGLQRYSDVAGLSFNDVALGGAGSEITGTFGASLRFDGVGTGTVDTPATFDLGNTAFRGLDAGSAQRHEIEFAPDNDFAFLRVDATGTTWDGVSASALTLTEAFAVEDRILHYVDKLNPTHLAAFGGEYNGFVDVQADQAFITDNVEVDGVVSVIGDGSVQRGIDIVAVDGTVHVSAGTFAEGSQITVDKNVDIVGQGQGVTILNPGFDTGSSGDPRGWWLVDEGVTLDVSGMTFDGTGNLVYQAFRHRGSGTFDDVEFTNIQYNASGPTYQGTAIAVFGVGSDVDVTNSTFSEIGRIGVLYFGSTTTGLFQGNTYTGKGAGDFLDYALDISAGAIIDVVDNEISGNQGVASVDGSTSAAILVSTFFDAGTTAALSLNTLWGNTTGVAIGFDSSDASTVTISGDNINANLGDGVSVRGSATLSVLNADLSGNASGAGVEVRDSASVLIQGTDLTGNLIGVAIDGGTVDLGQDGAGVDITGLGVSSGGNDFGGYAPATDSSGAIVVSEVDAVGGPQGLPLDVPAFGNLWTDASASGIEAVVYHDADDNGVTFVDFASLSGLAIAIDETTADNSVFEEGESLTLTGSFTNDPQAHTVTIVWGDGSPDTVLNLAAGVFDFSADHTYDDNSVAGEYDIVVTVEDSSSATVTDATTLADTAVANVAPTALDPVVTPPEDEDTVVTGVLTETATLPGDIPFSLFATDPGVNDLSTASFSFDNGQMIEVTIDSVTTQFADPTDIGVSYNDATGDFTFDPTGVAIFQSLPAGVDATVVIPFTVTDKEGEFDDGTVTFTVSGVNDAPVAEDVDFSFAGTVAIDEDETFAGVLDGDNSDGLVLDDTPGDGMTTGGTLANDVDSELTPASFAFTDADVTIDASTTNFTNLADLGIVYNDLTGEFSFTPDSAAVFNALAEGQLAEVVVNFTVTDDQSDTDTGSATFLVRGVNDAPVIGDGPDAEGLLETDGGLIASGSLTVSDADLTDEVTAAVDSVSVGGTGAGSVPVTLDNATLQSFLTVSPTAILDGVTDSATLTWDFNSGAEAFDFLADGETLVLEYTVSATDDDTAPLSDTETVTITVTGTNDAPVIGDGPDAEGLLETDGGLLASGSLTVSDADLTDEVTAAVDSVSVGGTGAGSVPVTLDNATLQSFLTVSPTAILDGVTDSATLTWDFNSGAEAFDFLADGETLVLEYTVSATDDDAAPLSDTETVTITVTGTNDAPVIGDGPDAEGLLETDGGLIASGSLTVSDADLTDEVTAAVDSVSVGGTGAGSVPVTLDNATLQSFLTVSPTAILDGVTDSATLTWDFNSGAEAFDFLADGETLVLEYTVSATDDDTAPLSDTETVTITVTGTNDAPVIGDGPDAEGLLETDGGLLASGSLTVSDADLTDEVTAAVDSVSVGGTGAGSVPVTLDNATLQSFLTVSPTAILDGVTDSATLTWDFNSGAEAFDFLADGETLVLEYTVSATDDDAAPLSDTETVTITVTGTNDAPVADAGGPYTIAEGDSLALTATGSDVDTSDSLSFSWDLNDDGVFGDAVGETPVLTFAQLQTLGVDDDGVYPIVVRVDDGTTTVDSSTTLTITNTPPTITLTGDADVDEGAVYTLDVSDLFDPGDETVTAISVTFGDSTAPELFLPGDLPKSIDHVYDDGEAGGTSRTITATVFDEDGAHVAATLIVTVNNVAPTALLFNGGAADEGSAGAVQFFAASYDDPSTADLSAGFLFSYDFDNDGVFEIVQTTSNTAVVPAEYLSDDPSQEVRGRIEDKDGGFTDVLTTITVNNVDPMIDAGADTIALADDPFTRDLTITDPGEEGDGTPPGEMGWLVEVDFDDDSVVDQSFFTTTRDFQISHTYVAAQLGQTFTVTVTIDDQDGGVDSDTFEVTVVEDTLRVVSFEPNNSGFDVQFNRAIDLSVLNLYDGFADTLFDAPDVTLVGDTVGSVSGSLDWDADTNTLSFLKTGGVLEADDYTVTLVSGEHVPLVSGSIGLQDAVGDDLDGDGDFMAGGDYTDTFTVAASTLVVGVQDFARGPDQPVDLTPTDALDTSLPVWVSDGTGVFSVDFDLVFDPDLLTIDVPEGGNIDLGPAVPSGWNAFANLVEPGVLRVSASGTVALGGVDIALVDLNALVPDTASYGATNVLRIEDLRVNEGNLDAMADDAVHKLVFLGDANGTQSYTGFDAALVSRVVVAIDAGYEAFDDTDPLIIGDVTQDGTLSGLDASLINQQAVIDLAGATDTVLEIPVVPVTTFAVSTAGVDPQFDIAEGILTNGEQAEVSVGLVVDPIEQGGVIAAGFSVEYDPAYIDYIGAELGESTPLGDGWNINAIEAVDGRIAVSMFGLNALAVGDSEISVLSFDVLGSTALPVELDIEPADPNDGGLLWTESDGSLDLSRIAGDYNNDGKVNAFDYTTWRENENTTTSPYTGADGDGDGQVDDADYDVWTNNYGRTLPPPISLATSEDVAEEAIEPPLEMLVEETPEAAVVVEVSTTGDIGEAPYTSDEVVVVGNFEEPPAAESAAVSPGEVTGSAGAPLAAKPRVQETARNSEEVAIHDESATHLAFAHLSSRARAGYPVPSARESSRIDEINRDADDRFMLLPALGSETARAGAADRRFEALGESPMSETEEYGLESADDLDLNAMEEAFGSIAASNRRGERMRIS